MTAIHNEPIPYKIYLEENEMPKAWYNLRADMINKPAPLLNPGTHQPMTAQELAPVFCEDLIQQELDDTTPYIPIPQEIQRLLQDVPSLAADAGLLPGKEARHPG